jgi:arylsulfatase A-like enzyme
MTNATGPDHKKKLHPSPNKIIMLKTLTTLFAVLLAMPVLAQHGGMQTKPVRKAPLPQRPNIIIILADDLGYGDLSCYGATKVKTPNIDHLAAGGLRFTDAHSSSATCTPSRYALLTGEYPWRKKGTDILPGDASLIIPPGTTTIASLLKSAGYTTGVVGKWHLGLGDGNIDWNTEIKPGPRELGFDYSFLIPATGDRVPCVFVENQRVVGCESNDPIQISYKSPIGTGPTGKDHPEMLKMKLSEGHDGTIVNGISRIGFMSGGHAARWKDEDIAATLTGKACKFIEENKGNPFFLYFATHDIHVPRVPGQRFAGSSGCGVRGDVIQQFDWSVGEIAKVIHRLNIATNTLLIVTSDNGPIVDDGYADGAEENLNGHKPAGPLRGTKYTIWEGGTRVPWIEYWPGQIHPGKTGALVCQIDLLRTFAALTHTTVPTGQARDSQDQLWALLGEAKRGRLLLVEHATGLALRDGNWKYIPGTTPQLYNLQQDIGETNNIAGSHPKVVEGNDIMLRDISKE